MEIKILNDKRQWNDFLLAQPTQAGVFLQSWEWGEFQWVMGRKVYRYRDNNNFAQVIEILLPFGKKYWYIPRGEIFEDVIEEARKYRALFIRIEPQSNYQLPITNYQLTQPIQPKQTLILDLSKSEEDLLASMHEKTRYNIRLAEKKNVKCKIKNVKCFEEFWKLMQETAKRDKFRTYPREYYEKMLSALNNPSQPPLNLRGGEGGVMSACLWIAYNDTTPIAGAIVVYFGDTATYLHGASSYEHRALMGPYALHWDIIKDAKKQGYKYYDFWGINEAESREHRAKSALSHKPYALRRKRSWAGITRFKLGFGGEVVNYPGAFDLPLSKFWYTVYRFGRRLRP